MFFTNFLKKCCLKYLEPRFLANCMATLSYKKRQLSNLTPLGLHAPNL